MSNITPNKERYTGILIVAETKEIAEQKAKQLDWINTPILAIGIGGQTYGFRALTLLIQESVLADDKSDKIKEWLNIEVGNRIIPTKYGQEPIFTFK